jgi:hypothetical protein
MYRFSNIRVLTNRNIHSHDNIAELMRVPCQSFNQMYEEKVEDFMRTVMEYVKIVRSAASARSSPGAGSGETILDIELDSDGFPKAPTTESLEKITKEDLERLYRSYMTQHYSLFAFIYDHFQC